jgi:hypothetical protein
MGKTRKDRMSQIQRNVEDVANKTLPIVCRRFQKLNAF